MNTQLSDQGGAGATALPVPFRQELGYVRLKLKSGETFVGQAAEVVRFGKAFIGFRELYSSGLQREKFFNGDVVHEFEPISVEQAIEEACVNVSVESIIVMVAGAFGLKPAEITGETRPDEVVRARHVAFRLARDKGYSFAEIGWKFGGRDHVTILKGIESLEARLQKEPETALKLRELRARLGEKDRNFYSPSGRAPKTEHRTPNGGDLGGSGAAAPPSQHSTFNGNTPAPAA